MAETRPLLRPSPLGLLGQQGGGASSVPGSPSPAIQAKMAVFSGGTELVLDHTLNQVKQTNQVIANTSKTAVSFEPSTNGSNVNIDCNSGFYFHVARPAFSQLSKGYQFNHPATSFYLSEVTPHLDHTMTEQGRLVKFTFFNGGVQQSLSVHLHHTTCKVQVQGGAIMPDRTTAAVWFVRNFIHDSFTSLAQSNRHRIDEFHKSLMDLVPDQSSSLPARSRKSTSSSDKGICIQCNKPLRKTARPPPPCPTGQCQGSLHSSCLKAHIRKPATPLALFPAPSPARINTPPPPPLSAPHLSLSPLSAFPALAGPSSAFPALTGSYRCDN